MTVDELREPRLHERAAVLLCADIVSGRIAPGEPFPSADDIVERFGVSRTVAREALQTLSMLGLVLVQHGKRTEVLGSENWDVLSPVVQDALRRENKHEPVWRDLYEFRLLIEPQAAGWMAEYGKAKDVDELDRLTTRMEELAETAVSVAEIMDADRRFHSLVARASDNRVLAAVSRDIREVIATLWGFSSLDAADSLLVAEQHRRIVDAVAARDPRAATGAMHDHLVWAAAADLHGAGVPARRRLASATAAE